MLSSILTKFKYSEKEEPVISLKIDDRYEGLRCTSFATSSKAIFSVKFLAIYWIARLIILLLFDGTIWNIDSVNVSTTSCNLKHRFSKLLISGMAFRKLLLIFKILSVGAPPSIATLDSKLQSSIDFLT